MRLKQQVFTTIDVSLSRKELVRNSIEYLFTVWNPALKQKNELLRLLEEGFEEAPADDVSMRWVACLFVI